MISLNDRHNKFNLKLESIFTEFIQPQHIWPYIQHNFIQQSQIQSHGYHMNNNTHHNNISPTNHNPSEIDNLSNGSQPGSELQDDNRLHPRDKQLIAKPLASRPTPFIHHGINHPHLHSLLAHCRNPYMTGKIGQIFIVRMNCSIIFVNSQRVVLKFFLYLLAKDFHGPIQREGNLEGE